MPKTNQPYDPQPERTDALGELAREGYQVVPGDHAARLQSLQDRLSLPSETVPVPDATMRTMRPRRWLAVAAGIAALVVAGIALYTYDSQENQIAKVMSPKQEEIQEELGARVEEASDVLQKDHELASTTAIDAPIQLNTNRPSNVGVESVQDIGSQGVVVYESDDLVTASAKPPKELPSSTNRQKATSKKSQSPEDRAVVSQPPVEAEPVVVASVPAPANSINSSKRAPEEDASILSDEGTTDTEIEESATSFRMERAAAVQTREITGEVIEPSGAAVIGAKITIEETGQQVVTGQKGEFLILVTDEAIVGEIQAEGYSTFLFDVTAGEEFRIFLPRVASSLPSAQLKGKDIGLRIVAPKAEVYPVFDEYISTKRSEFPGEKVVVQFDVNRFGRPRQIVSGPGKQNRDAVKEVKDWLKNGPDWPEVYQKNTWRYEVELK